MLKLTTKEEKMTDAEPKLRWSKFWWKDWQGDQGLRSCSVAARGFWMDLLCIAHEGEPYGYVTINGTAPTTKRLAIISGVTENSAKSLLEELREAGVFSVSDDGIIFSRRMVRDKAASDAGKKNGKNGGNPSLKANETEPDNTGGNEGGLTPPLIDGVKLEAEAEERERGKKESSVPSERATALPSPPDPPDARAEFWREGLAIVRNLTGRPDGASRAFLGRILKTLADDCDAGLQVLHAAYDLRPGGPEAWIVAACKARAARKTTGISARKEKILRAGGLWAEDGTTIDITQPERFLLQ
jgi:hypothetical protein